MFKNITLENLILGAICVGVAAVAVLYYTGNLTIQCSKNKYTYEGYPTSACGYLAETVKGTINEADINQLCQIYQKTCGNGSTAAEIVGLDSLDPTDPDNSYVNALQQDVLVVKLNPVDCAPLLQCDPAKGISCPSFLACNNGTCS